MSFQVLIIDAITYQAYLGAKKRLLPIPGVLLLSLRLWVHFSLTENYKNQKIHKHRLFCAFVEFICITCVFRNIEVCLLANQLPYRLCLV